MSRGPSSFRQQGVTRALRGAVLAGMAVQRVEIGRGGKIVLITRSEVPVAAENATGCGALDSWRASRVKD